MVINIKELLFCKAESYCTDLVLTGDRHVLSSQNLLHYDEMLKKRSFFKVHNSYLINLHHVREFIKVGSVILTDNQTVPIGNTYRRRFIDFFNRLKKPKTDLIGERFLATLPNRVGNFSKN